MTEVDMPRRRRRLAILALLALPTSCVTWGIVANPLAEHQARAFCDGLPIGADLAPRVAAFDREHPGANGRVSVRHYANEQPPGHVFMFPGFLRDKAYCTVETDARGQVVSRKAFFLADD